MTIYYHMSTRVCYVTFIEQISTKMLTLIDRCRVCTHKRLFDYSPNQLCMEKRNLREDLWSIYICKNNEISLWDWTERDQKRVLHQNACILYHLQVYDCSSMMTTMVKTPACVNILPRWLGLSTNTSHWRVDGSKVIVRQFPCDIQAIWQLRKEDPEIMVDGEQPLSTHWYFLLPILDNRSVRKSCAIPYRMIMNRKSTTLRFISIKYWDCKKIIVLNRKKEMVTISSLFSLHSLFRDTLDVWVFILSWWKMKKNDRRR